MNGLNRGSFSFVALLVINPIVILLYQNCTVSPLSQNRSAFAQQNYQSYRTPSNSPSSLPMKSYWESDKSLELVQKAKLCLEENQTCYNTPQKQ